MVTSHPTDAHADVAANTTDLGPLAWVLDETRKSIESANQSLKRFVHESEAARGDDSAADASPLQSARQQLHQAAGVLEMVEQHIAARMARSMEAAVQQLARHPGQEEAAAATLEHAGFALAEYLESQLGMSPRSALGLFPSYRQVQDMAGADRVHPADLWDGVWRWSDPATPPAAQPLVYGTDARKRMNSCGLKIMQYADANAAAELADISLELAAGEADAHPAIFWKLCAGFFQALGQSLVPMDVYVKKTVARVLLQYTSLARGGKTVSERLALDLLFFCAQARPAADRAAPALAAVREAWGLSDAVPVDYEQPVFGLYDPAVLAQARRRIDAVKENWSALAGGDLARLKTCISQFDLVIESLTQLHEKGKPLAEALRRVAAQVARSGRVPGPELAMETATAVLFLEASFVDFQPGDARFIARLRQLGERLDSVRGGAPAPAVESWMEDLYRGVSDHQTMGTVVGELRTTLGEVEQHLDRFFRDPADKSALTPVPALMSQMRGVLSLLDLDQAALAVERMSDAVNGLLAAPAGQTAGPGIFEPIGRSLGALGFQIDMMSYQPVLARALFIYDTDSGELRYIAGRRAAAAGSDAGAKAVSGGPGPTAQTADLIDLSVDTPSGQWEQIATLAAIDGKPALAGAANRPAEAAPEPAPADGGLDAGDDELLGIFLEEAREVVQTGKNALRALRDEPGDLEQQTTLRRAFHTLKGSSRMVGLAEFGEAAWAMEQWLNAWLVEQKPVSQDMRDLAGEAIDGLARWVDALAAQQAEHWRAAPFREAADALRMQGKRLPLASMLTAPATIPQAAAPQPLGATTSVTPTKVADEIADVGDLLDQFLTEFHTSEFQASDPPGAPLPEAGAGKAASASVVSAVSDVSDVSDDQKSPVEDEEPYKQIGDLRISAPLYNVYLSEADEWSRQLSAELAEWALRPDHPVPEPAMTRAHSLAGTSATVGFAALSRMARAVEHALQRLADEPRATSAHARALNDAAEDIRGVLNQFAAGVLRLPDESILAAVQAIEPAPPTQETAAPDMAPADVAPTIPAIFAAHTAPRVAMGATGYRSGSGDGIDLVDAVDPDLFPIFQEEARELLPQLSASLRRWAGRPDDLVARGEALRALHTLKGSARLAGALRLGEMAHRTESAIEVIGTEKLRTQDIEPLLDDLDSLLEIFHGLQAVVASVGAEAAAPHPAAVLEALQPPAPAQVIAPPGVEQAAVPAPVAVVRGEVAEPAALSLATARAAASQTVRVRSQLLDRLVDQAGEIMSSRARLETEMGQLRSALSDLTGNLERLRRQLRDVELQAETQMQSRLAQSKDSQQNFDPLEFDRFTRMQEVTRMMAESVNDVATVQRGLQRAIEVSEGDLAVQARQSRELQRDLLRTRMIEFENISEWLYRIVRQSAKELDKQVRLDIVGGNIEMDRGILERMTPAFEHLLRNCVVHGIETPAERGKLGKDPVGTVTIEIHQSGNDVSIAFRDDGAGLDLRRIRECAVEKGMIAPDQSLTDAEIRNLVFMSGLTTITNVTALAGRGVGMDVARTEVQAIGGRIEIESAENKGTTFRLVLPLTTAVTHVVMMRAGQLAVGVPSSLVEIVRRVSEQELKLAYESGRYRYGGEDLPFYWAGALLQHSAHSAEPPARTTPIIVLHSAEQRVAMHVDEVLGNQEVVVKPLGPQLAHLPGLVAITVLASGAVGLIYNPVALATVYGTQARALSAAPTQLAAGAPRSDIPLVLVVDDSITVRRVTQRLLHREGYRVALAADGLQGLEQLQIERPAVVLSDIEMPRMDGFDFVRNIRADEKLRDLPVIMITSRIAAKHRGHANELGVDHYLGKPYSEDKLLTLIKDYVRARRRQIAVTDELVAE